MADPGDELEPRSDAAQPAAGQPDQVLQPAEPSTVLELHQIRRTREPRNLDVVPASEAITEPVLKLLA